MEVCKLCTSSRSLPSINLFNIDKHFSKEDGVTNCLSRRVRMSCYIDRNMTVKTISHCHARERVTAINIFLNAFGNQNKTAGDSLQQTVDLTSVRMHALHLLMTY